MKRLLIIVIFILCLLFDLISEYTQLLRVPFALLSACLALALLLPAWNSIIFAASGGLILDLLRNSFLGATSALYIFAILGFSRFNTKTKPRVFTVVAAGLFIGVQLCFAAAASLIGRNIPYLRLLLTDCLLPAAFTALLCWGLRLLFGRILFGRRRTQ
jgi:cell shape-determining protein MreD